MKARIGHIIIVATVLFSLASCRKETSVENSTGLGGSFMANIDGVQWIAADSTKGASILQGMINLSGISTDHRQLSITLDDTVPGVYTLNQVSVSLGAYADNDSTNLYAFTTNQGKDTSQAGGLVTVTAIDTINKTLSGTFSFKVYRDIDHHQKNLTNGVFYKLPYLSSLPVSSSKDTMYAKIDGANWVGQSIVATAFSNLLSINGSNLDGSQSVSLIMPADITPGTYQLAYPLPTYIGAYNPQAGISLISTNGSLDILENNSATRRVRGNFQYLAADANNNGYTSHRLSSGYFSIQYN